MRHDDEIERGRALRQQAPRRSQSTFVPDPGRDPLGVLAAQETTRLPELVGLRRQRMTTDPFAFYRGTAAIMAADLRDTPSSGIDVIACGDAHISNFGFFASPQRTLVFDLNDFDEAAIGPWEWDVKRLVTSVVIGARANGWAESRVRKIARRTAEAYRVQLDRIMGFDVLERFYLRADTDRIREIVPRHMLPLVERAERDAALRTSESAAAKMTEKTPEGRWRFIEQPPRQTHLPDAARDYVEHLLDDYLATLTPDIALLLSQYRLEDVVRRAVGVGSVGTRCFVLLLSGPAGEPLILQVKQAEHSVYASFGGRDDAMTDHDGERVVGNQRILQAVSDPFLGWVRAAEGDFYIRQFRDMKASVDLAALSPSQFATYAAGCAASLARGHGQSPAAAAIAGYLGSSSVFDDAVTEFAFAYADQSLADWRLVAEAGTPAG